jgi:hypothetical protein
MAARKPLEIANATEAVQDGRIHIEKINAPAGLAFTITRGAEIKEASRRSPKAPAEILGPSPHETIRKHDSRPAM